MCKCFTFNISTSTQFILTPRYRVSNFDEFVCSSLNKSDTLVTTQGNFFPRQPCGLSIDCAIVVVRVVMVVVVVVVVVVVGVN